MHFLLDQLYVINHGKLVIGVKDQFPNAQLFSIKFDCYGQIINYLKKGYFDDDMRKE